MVVLAERNDATCAALFMLHEGRPSLVAQFDLNQLALNTVHGACAQRRDELGEGTLLHYGEAVVWPLFDDRQLVGLAYLNRAPESFPDDKCRQEGADIVAHLRQWTPPSNLGAYVASGLSLVEAGKAVERDVLAGALELMKGNVSAVADMFNVTRETIYRRADRLHVDIDRYRKRTRTS